MCVAEAAIIVSTGLQIFGAINQANQQEEAGKAQAKYYESLAKNKEQESKVNQEIGALQTNQLQRENKKLIGRQQAAVAASGLGYDSKTSNDIYLDTLKSEQLDEMAVKYNADIQSWNLLNQAKQLRKAGSNALEAAETNKFSSLLGTASNIGKNLFQFNKG